MVPCLTYHHRLSYSSLTKPAVRTRASRGVPKAECQVPVHTPVTALYAQSRVFPEFGAKAAKVLAEGGSGEHDKVSSQTRFLGNICAVQMRARSGGFSRVPACALGLPGAGCPSPTLHPCVPRTPGNLLARQSLLVPQSQPKPLPASFLLCPSSGRPRPLVDIAFPFGKSSSSSCLRGPSRPCCPLGTTVLSLSFNVSWDSLERWPQDKCGQRVQGSGQLRKMLPRRTLCCSQISSSSRV